MVKSLRHIPMVSSELTNELSLGTWRASHLLPRDRPQPSTPPNSLDHSLLPVHLQTCSITAFQCISILALARHPTASASGLKSGRKFHFQTRSITVW